MRAGLLIAVALTATFAAAAVAAGPAGKNVSVGPLTVGPLEAVFVPAEFATSYAIAARDIDLKPGQKLSFRWQLDLALVDPVGASPPGDPGSHAAVDLRCDNRNLAGSRGAIGADGGLDVWLWSGLGNQFTWYHGDTGAYPGSDYGCDHTKMGPSGHEGFVSVEVTTPDGQWACYASIGGTNLATAPAYGAAPVCESRLRADLQHEYDTVHDAIAGERHALDDIGGDNAAVDRDLVFWTSLLSGTAADLRRQGAGAGAVEGLQEAARLDEAARKEDLTTKAGQTKALNEIAAALKLKKKALPLINDVISRTPVR